MERIVNLLMYFNTRKKRFVYHFKMIQKNYYDAIFICGYHKRFKSIFTFSINQAYRVIAMYSVSVYQYNVKWEWIKGLENFSVAVCTVHVHQNRIIL